MKSGRTNAWGHVGQMQLWRKENCSEPVNILSPQLHNKNQMNNKWLRIYWQLEKGEDGPEKADGQCKHNHRHGQGKMSIEEEETDRGEGKSQPCCLGDGIPCRTRKFRMVWRKGLLEEWTLGRMDASEKWMIIWFTPHQTTVLPNWIIFQKLFFKSFLLLNS